MVTKTLSLYAAWCASQVERDKAYAAECKAALARISPYHPLYEFIRDRTTNLGR
jgi:hypothetical protein